MDNWFSWTDEVFTEMAELWSKGCDQRQISEAIGTTRNAVAGKINRLRASGDNRFPTRAKNTRKGLPLKRIRKLHGEAGSSSPILAHSHRPRTPEPSPSGNDKENVVQRDLGVTDSICRDEREEVLSAAVDMTAGETAKLNISAVDGHRRGGELPFVERWGNRRTIPLKHSHISKYDSSILMKQRKTLLELRDNHCRWPIGNPQEPNFFFCGAERWRSYSYCHHHAKQAFRPR